MPEVNINTPGFRYSIPAKSREKWVALYERTGIPQTQILNRLVEFILLQDETTQSMILGTLKPTEELLEIALRRMREVTITDQDKDGELARRIKERAALSGRTVNQLLSELGVAMPMKVVAQQRPGSAEGSPKVRDDTKRSAHQRR